MVLICVTKSLLFSVVATQDSLEAQSKSPAQCNSWAPYAKQRFPQWLAIHPSSSLLPHPSRTYSRTTTADSHSQLFEWDAPDRPGPVSRHSRMNTWTSDNQPLIGWALRPSHSVDLLACPHCFRQMYFFLWKLVKCNHTTILKSLVLKKKSKIPSLYW